MLSRYNTETFNNDGTFPDSKVHAANMGPIWVLSAPDGPHVGPMNLALRVYIKTSAILLLLYRYLGAFDFWYGPVSTDEIHYQHSHPSIAGPDSAIIHPGESADWSAVMANILNVGFELHTTFSAENIMMTYTFCMFVFDMGIP